VTRGNSRLLFGAVLLAAAVMRFAGLSWDDRRHLHPDERFLSMVSDGIEFPKSVAAYFDSAHSPLNPFNRKFEAFVYGTFLCCLWSIVRIFVRAASGRQRFNVLGAWNAVTRELISITNTTVVNTDTMCELLRAVASRGLIGPVTMVLDNARYQRNAVVQGLAADLGIVLLFLPSYSPNLNLIERLWRFMKRKAAYGRYHPTFADFRAAIEDVLARVPTTHANKLASLMTLNFQEFDEVSLLAA